MFILLPVASTLLYWGLSSPDSEPEAQIVSEREIALSEQVAGLGILDSLTELGTLHREQGNLQKALLTLKKAQRVTRQQIRHAHTPKEKQQYRLYNARIHYELGRTYRMAGNCSEALQNYRRAYHIYQNNPYTHYTDLLLSEHALWDMKLYLGIH